MGKDTPLTSVGQALPFRNFEGALPLTPRYELPKMLMLA